MAKPSNRMSNPVNREGDPQALPLASYQVDLTRPPAVQACPRCGRLTQAYIERTRLERSETVCRCGFCGQRWTYVPPMQRMISG